MRPTTTSSNRASSAWCSRRAGGAQRVWTYANVVNAPSGDNASTAAARTSRCRLSAKAAHGRPLTIASARSRPRLASTPGRSPASASATSTVGYRVASRTANRSLSSTAMCRPRPARRCWIWPVKAPVPAPSSTTTASRSRGIDAAMTRASVAPLGATAPTVRGLRMNSPRNDIRPALSPVSPDRGGDVAQLSVAAGRRTSVIQLPAPRTRRLGHLTDVPVRCPVDDGSRDQASRTRVPRIAANRAAPA